MPWGATTKPSIADGVLSDEPQSAFARIAGCLETHDGSRALPRDHLDRGHVVARGDVDLLTSLHQIELNSGRRNLVGIVQQRGTRGRRVKARLGETTIDALSECEVTEQHLD